MVESNQSTINMDFHGKLLTLRYNFYNTEVERETHIKPWNHYQEINLSMQHKVKLPKWYKQKWPTWQKSSIIEGRVINRHSQRSNFFKFSTKQCNRMALRSNIEFWTMETRKCRSTATSNRLRSVNQTKGLQVLSISTYIWTWT